MTNFQAGEYGPFTLSFGRSDQDQFLSWARRCKTPPGLLGSLTHVRCVRNRRRRRGLVGRQSLIGHTQVLTGPGADPFLVTGGQVFLTEGYKGAPFGLSIVVPAEGRPVHALGDDGPGHGGRAGGDLYRSAYGGVDGEERSVADDAGWDPVAAEGRERDDRPTRVHFQPDKLRKARRSPGRCRARKG